MRERERDRERDRERERKLCHKIQDGVINILGYALLNPTIRNKAHYWYAISMCKAILTF